MIADVQSWLNSPSTNFGWAVVNSDETDATTFRAFWTKEAPTASLRPELIVSYTPAPEPSTRSTARLRAGGCRCLEDETQVALRVCPERAHGRCSASAARSRARRRPAARRMGLLICEVRFVTKTCLQRIAAWSLVAIISASGRATTVTIGGASDINIARDVNDATIFENDPDNSNGAGPGMFSGTDGSGLPLRGLLRFDVADNVPAGATIFNVQLELFLGKVAGSGGGGGPGSGVAFSNIELHKLSTGWGEGTTGSGDTQIGTTGQGFPANPGDATWNAAFYPSTAWTNPGGDFAPTASAVATVGTTMNAASTWGTTPARIECPGLVEQSDDQFRLGPR